MAQRSKELDSSGRTEPDAQLDSGRWSRWLPLVYLAFGVLWILASDNVVGWMFGDSPNLLLVVSTAKGFAFVIFTAIVLAVWWRSEQNRSAALVAHAEQRANLASNRLAWATRHANDIVLLFDERGRLLDCNETAERIYGYSRDELLGMSIHDLRRPGQDESRNADAQFTRVRDQGHYVFETMHRRKDGSLFPVEVSSARTTFEGRSYVQSIVRDTSERGEAERARAAANKRIERQRDLYNLLSRCNHVVARLEDQRSLFASVATIAVEHGRFLFAWVAEPRADGGVDKVAMHGHDAGYVAAVQVSVHADDPNGGGPVGRSLREGHSVVSNRFLEESSTTPWHGLAQASGVAACASIPVRLRGRVVAALVVYASEPDYFDPEIVTTLEEVASEMSFALETLETRRELHENRNLLEGVINASGTPVYVFDRAGRALLVNDACAALFGLARAEIMGRTRASLLPDEEASYRMTDARVIESGRTVVAEERLRRADGERVYLAVKFPLRNQSGEIYAVGGVSTDITELRRAQSELAQANTRLEAVVAERTRELVAAKDRAEQADRAKTAFLSTVSHELRTPLNSILGFTDIVLEGLSGPLNDEQRRHLGMARDSAAVLLGLINEILDMSRIEAGRVQLNSERFDLAELLRRCVAALEPQASSKGLALRCLIGSDVASMTSDPKRVAQVVTNILSNAVKFTRAGSVVLDAKVVGGTAVAIEIDDTGPGIAPDDLQQLFKPFVQVGTSRRQAQEGTGLGLAIARQLSHALGGDIEVCSEVGKGTRFVIKLPLDMAESADAGGTGLYSRMTLPHPK